jgi:hypothetical protein
MPERPKVPIGPLLAWVALIADGVALYLLFRSEQPMSTKLAVGGAEAVGGALIVAYYVGRLREWVRCSTRVKELERELERMRIDSASAAASSSARRAA